MGIWWRGIPKEGGAHYLEEGGDDFLEEGENGPLEEGGDSPLEEGVKGNRNVRTVIYIDQHLVRMDS